MIHCFPTLPCNLHIASFAATASTLSWNLQVLSGFLFLILPIPHLGSLICSAAQLLSCLHASQTCLYLWQYGTYNFLSQTPLLVLTLSTLIFICWWTLVFTPCCFFSSQRKGSLKCDYFTSLFLSLASTSQLSYFTLLLTICRILPISKTDGLTWQWHFHASCQESSC